MLSNVDVHTSSRRSWMGTALWAVGLIVLVGIALRVREFLALRSLWLDEVALYLQIKGRNYEELFWTGVRGNQGAPAAYLLLTRLALLNISTLEVGVRIVAFVAGLGVLFTTAVLALRSFTDTCSRIVACVLIAGSPLLIYYSTEGKQYILDTFIASLIFLTCLRYEAGKVGLKTLLFLGVVAVWFAHSAALVLCAGGSVLILKELLRRNYPQAGRLVAICGAWIASFVFQASTNMTFLLNNRALYWHWGEGMAPWDRGFVAVMQWSFMVWYELLLFISTPTSYRFGVNAELDRIILVWVGFLVVGMVLGLVRLWRVQSVIAPYLTGLFAVVFLVAACRLSPMSSRIVLYLVPGIYFCFAAFVGWIFSSLSNKVVRVSGVLFLFVIMAGVPLYDTVQGAVSPHVRSDMKGAVSYLITERAPDEPVFVKKVDAPTYMVYAKRLKLSDRTFSTFSVSERSLSVMQARFVKALLSSPTKSIWIVAASRPYQIRQTLEFMEDGCCSVVKRRETQGSVAALVIRKDRKALREPRTRKTEARDLATERSPKPLTALN